MKHYLKCGLVAALLFVLSSFAYLGGILDRVEYMVNDGMYQSYREINPNIFVIGIDGDTLNQYGPWGTWSRKTVAELVQYLNEDEVAKPAVIGLDIMFTGNTTDGEDQSLVAAVENGGNVVLASQVFFSPILATQQDNRFTNLYGIQAYETAFDDLFYTAPSGLINVFPDADGVVRKGIYSFTYGDKELYSFSAQIAKAYGAHIGQSITPPSLDANGEWPVAFAGKPGDFFGSGTKGTSWVRVMNQEIPRELFADSIVLIGPYTTGMMDHYYTSANRSVPMYGLEIHANMVQCILEGNYKSTLPGTMPILITLVFSVLVYAFFCKMTIKRWTLSVAALFGGYIALALVLYKAGWILPVFYPLLSIVLIYLALMITNSIMLTLEKASLYDQLHQLFIDSIRTIVNAVDAKDPCTSGHCQRVAEYSLLMGEALHFSHEDLADLEYAALLHDVGKIGISDSVLKKEGALSDEEYNEMKKHPLLGFQILGEIKEFRGRIADGAKYHHERYDGRGYCEGITGEDIPLFGRIIAIADAYDAMTQNRPYHRRMTQKKAIEEIQKNKGTQFDPHLAQMFVEILKDYPEPEEGKPVGYDSEDVPSV